MHLAEYVSTKFNERRPTALVNLLKRNYDEMLDELINETTFLSIGYSEPTIQQRLFHYVNRIDHIIVCEVCGKPAAIKLKNARITSKKSSKKFSSHYTSTCENLKCRKIINVLKSEEGMLVKYGVKNISHIKPSYKMKQYQFPSGKIVNLQGYEPRAVDFILKSHSEIDIIVQIHEIEKKVGRIFYEINGKRHRYYPDIFIPSENKIIEVKSKYTYLQNLEINNEKKNACIKAGFNFEFMIL
jgi:hypothetical protein